MKTRVLGKSRLRSSVIGMGCWAFGGGTYWGEQSQTMVNAVVARALDLGVNYFDTAEVYNNGASEVSLGLALKGRREQAIIGSKISPSNCFPETLRAHLDASLERLQTDYIDVYMIHWPIEPRSIEHFTKAESLITHPPTLAATLDTLDTLRDEGKIRFIAVSNHGVEQLEAVIAGAPGIIANEITYNLFSRAIEARILPLCKKHGISVIGTMALQQGILAGNFMKAEDIPPPQAHSRHFKQERGLDNKTGINHSRHFEAGCEKEMFKALSAMREIASAQGISVAQLAIAWAMKNASVACTLVGSRNLVELEENVKAAEYEMPGKVYKALNVLSKPAWEKLGDNPDYYENRAKTRIH